MSYPPVNSTAIALQVEKELLADLPKEELFPFAMTVVEHQDLEKAVNAILDALNNKQHDKCPSFEELQTLDDLLPKTSHLHHLLHDHADTKLIGAKIALKHTPLDKHKHSSKEHMLGWLHERVHPLVDAAQAVGAYLRVRKGHSEYFEMGGDVRFYLRPSTNEPRWKSSPTNALLVV